jgi:hypothetical protein
VTDEFTNRELSTTVVILPLFNVVWLFTQLVGNEEEVKEEVTLWQWSLGNGEKYGSPKKKSIVM